MGTYSFSYVPGAGDDEESWAQGLTPALFWQHQQVNTPVMRAVHVNTIPMGAAPFAFVGLMLTMSCGMTFSAWVYCGECKLHALLGCQWLACNYH